MSVTTYLSWEDARWIALGIVIVVLGLGAAICVVARDIPKRGGLLNGTDNRWSTSKVSMLLWTLAVLWAFLTLLLRFGGTAIAKSVPASYFALLGIPSASTLAAKAVTSSRVAAGTLAKTQKKKGTVNPFEGVAEIFCDDTGALDLLDSQYFLFNLVLLGYFIAGFFHVTVSTSNVTLPALPGSLLALSGVSAVSYIGKKGLGGGAATTTSLLAGSALTVSGLSDVSAPGGAKIELPAAAASTVSPGVTYATTAGASVATTSGGSMVLTDGASLVLARGAQVTCTPGVVIHADAPATAILSNGSTAVDAQGAAAPAAAPGLGTALATGTIVTLGSGGELVVTSETAALTLAAGSTVSYVAAGKITVAGATAVIATLSAGAQLTQQLTIAEVTFPLGATYVDPAKSAKPLQAANGGAVKLGPPAAQEASQGIVLIDQAQAVLPTGTIVEFVAEPAPVGSGVASTASNPTTITFAGGGTLTIETGYAGVAARVPSGSTISVDDGVDKPATVTTVST
jgi:hypothetical protein